MFLFISALRRKSKIMFSSKMFSVLKTGQREGKQVSIRPVHSHIFVSEMSVVAKIPCPEFYNWLQKKNGNCQNKIDAFLHFFS
jgi:hypothetical protein